MHKKKLICLDLLKRSNPSHQNQMEEEEDALPPFWLQKAIADGQRLRRSYSLLFSSGALLIFLLVIALAFIFIIAPTLHSFTSQIFKPHSVKKTWDSLNLLLVFFALLCGFLSRNHTNEETPRSNQGQNFSVSDISQEYAKPNPETPRHWYEYDYSDRTLYKPYSRLRSFNSYPDLRQESSWVAADERWQFYDDTHVNGYRGLDLDDDRELRRRRPRPLAGEEEELGIKNVEVDTFVVRKKGVPNAPPPPASPPPAPRCKDDRRNSKRTHQAIGQAKNHDLGSKKLQPRPATPPPPTERTGKNKNKRGSATREFLTSLKGKNKKQRPRSVENFESILNSRHPTLPWQPPPPPPPPPPSVFHSLFSSKKSKHKKHQSVSPPQPPHVSSSKTKPLIGGVTNLKPRLSNKRENFYTLDENVVAGNESPLIPIPPPPPPPPFKMPAWKFKVQGDYVRIDSISSSSSGSPDLDEVVDSPTSEAGQCNSPTAPDGGEPEILLFYPSPDVDTKADTFIEKFRAGLRMEKMNSTKEKQGIGRSKSNLGPSPIPETKQEAGPS